MTIINAYKNGNYWVTLHSDGTKVRENGLSFFSPEVPESMDMKITNYCDLYCPYCHEMSTTEGVHSNTERLLDNLRSLPAGVEIAIGGGDAMSHPSIDYILEVLNKRGLVCNMTVNQRHMQRTAYRNKVEAFIDKGLLKAVGISITSGDFSALKEVKKYAVPHLIIGVHDIGMIESTLSSFGKALFLGYKQVGRGIQFFNPYVDIKIKEVALELHELMLDYHISFDNLAIEQLNLRKFFTQQFWDMYYMGEEGQFSMYYDAVREEYAISSTSSERSSCSDFRHAADYFKKMQQSVIHSAA